MPAQTHSKKQMPVGYDGGSKYGIRALQNYLWLWNAGAGEIGGNNRGTWVKRFLNGLVAEGNSWCAGVYSYCHTKDAETDKWLYEEGDPFEYKTLALGIRNVFRKNGWLYLHQKAGRLVPEDICPLIMPGDTVIFERGTISDAFAHIGIVHSVSTDKRKLYTVEGNRTSKVEGFEFDLLQQKDIIALGRVPDDAVLIARR